jgi:hypothetical protein
VKGEEGIRKDNYLKRNGRVINRDIAVFAFFLFLSFIFWYLNSLGKDVEADIKCQVKYTNIPKEKGKIEDPTAALNLYLKGPGYSILKLKLSGNKAPFIIDFSKVNYKRVTGSKALTYFIVTSGLTRSLNIQIRSGCEIISIKPDTLFFTFNKVAVNSHVTPDNRNENKKKR